MFTTGICCHTAVHREGLNIVPTPHYTLLDTSIVKWLGPILTVRKVESLGYLWVWWHEWKQAHALLSLTRAEEPLLRVFCWTRWLFPCLKGRGFSWSILIDVLELLTSLVPCLRYIRSKENRGNLAPFPQFPRSLAVCSLFHVWVFVCLYYA